MINSTLPPRHTWFLYKKFRLSGVIYIVIVYQSRSPTWLGYTFITAWGSLHNRRSTGLSCYRVKWLDKIRKQESLEGLCLPTLSALFVSGASPMHRARLSLLPDLRVTLVFSSWCLAIAPVYCPSLIDGSLQWRSKVLLIHLIYTVITVWS